MYLPLEVFSEMLDTSVAVTVTWAMCLHAIFHLLSPDTEKEKKKVVHTLVFGQPWPFHFPWPSSCPDRRFWSYVSVYCQLHSPPRRCPRILNQNSRTCPSCSFCFRKYKNMETKLKVRITLVRATNPVRSKIIGGGILCTSRST